MSDPLTCVRETFIANGVIERDGDHYRVGQRRYPVDTPTAYRSNNGKDDLITLDAIVILLQAQVKQKVKMSEYFRLCREHGVKKTVPIIDFKDLLAFLTGATSSSECIDVEVRLEQMGQSAKDADVSSQAGGLTVADLAPSKPPSFDYRKDEIETSTRDSVLQNKRKVYSLAAQIVEQVWKEDARAISETTHRSSSRKHHRGGVVSVAPVVSRGGPIILVPNSHSAVITIFNAKEFLEEGRWVSSIDKRAAMSSSVPEFVTIHRKAVPDGHQQAQTAESRQRIEYRIYQEVDKFTPDMWNRVVAVFVQGQSWQFKDWKLGSSPQEVFERAYCCHLHYEDEKPHANAVTWGIKYFSVSKSRRHLTMSVYHTIWQQIEKFMVANKKAFVLF